MVIHSVPHFLGLYHAVNQFFCYFCHQMKRHDRAYWSAWVLLVIFVPMVLLSSLHVHPELLEEVELCNDCIDHSVHGGHIAPVKAVVDCPLCAFQSNVYQGEEETLPSLVQSCCRLVEDKAIPSVSHGVSVTTPSRAPPFSFCT